MADPSQTPSDTGSWVLDTTRGVSLGGYYRFGVAVAANLTSDNVSAVVNSKGWDLKSIGGAPADVAASLSGLTKMGLTVWWIHAYWNSPATTIPDNDTPLYYGPIEEYQGATQTSNWSPDQNQNDAPTPSVWQPAYPVLGLIAGAGVAAAIIWLTRDIHR